MSVPDEIQRLLSDGGVPFYTGYAHYCCPAVALWTSPWYRAL